MHCSHAVGAVLAGLRGDAGGGGSGGGGSGGEWVDAGAHADAEPALHVARELRRERARNQVSGQVVQIKEHLVAVAAPHIGTFVYCRTARVQ